MSKNLETVREYLEGLTVWSLARRADVADPDAAGSPGWRFLESVRDDVTEALEFRDTETELTPDYIRGMSGDDWPHEAADAAVPVYTAERWRAFTDLAAWTVDVSDLAGGGEDMTTLAGFALYEAARELIATLLDDAADALEAATV